MIEFLQQTINGLSVGALYALFALGFTLIFGVLGVVNLSHGAVFMCGTYAAYGLLHLYPQASLVELILVGAIVSGLIGLLIDIGVLKWLRKRNAPHLIPMIATIGVAIVLNNGVQALAGADNKTFPAELLSSERITLGQVLGAGESSMAHQLSLSSIEIIIISVCCVLMLFLFWMMRHTMTGRALRAIAESPKAAALQGVPVEKMFMLTSILAAALGGVAGILTGFSTGAFSPLIGQSVLHKGIAVIILGGMGDIRGAVIASLFIGLAEVYAVAYGNSEMRDAVAFGLLFFILVLRPQGIFGKVLERKA